MVVLVALTRPLVLKSILMRTLTLWQCSHFFGMASLRERILADQDHLQSTAITIDMYVLTG